MNEDRIKGQWKQLAGKLKEKWGKLTDNDLQRADGSSEYLAGRLQLDPLITRRIKLSEINEGFAALARGEGIRTVVMFD